MSSKKFIKLVFIGFSLMYLIPFSFAYIYLKANYENNSFENIVKRQISNNSIYGTALNQNTFGYKLELIKQIKPDIVSLGSSRVMQFRKESFNKSFVNAGGAMNHLNEGLIFLEQMYKVHKPKYLILGLDFWWFNEYYFQPLVFPYHQNYGDILDYNKIAKSYYWLINGKNDLLTIGNVMNQNFIRNNYTNYDNLGFSAIKTSDGFRADGSYFYSKLIFGIEKSDDENFINTLTRIKNGNNRFEYGNNLSTDRLLILQKILNLVKLNNTKIIIVVPPVANYTFKNMEIEKYSYVKKLQKYLQNIDSEIYDFHNLSKLTDNDCECVDGFHGGDVIYQRILKNIYNENSILKEYINMDLINLSIKKNEGKVLSISDESKYKLTKEVDFLEIGCKK